MKISVIVPVYNAQATLERCVASVCNQTYRDFELILIDDGSSDKSGLMCDKYARKDSRIQVYHQNNQGQSIARNQGMERSSGTYVMFMDSDDAMPDSALADLTAILNTKSYDIVCGQFKQIKKGKAARKEYPFMDGEVSRKAVDSRRYHRIKTENLFGYCWGKLYRRDFLKEHNIVFDDIRKIFMEDTIFNLKAWIYNPSYYYCSSTVYHYYLYDNTSSNKKIERIEEKCVAALECYMDVLAGEGQTERQLDVLIPLIARMFCWASIHERLYGKKDKQETRKSIHAFVQNEKIHAVLQIRGSMCTLRHLPSIVQRIFYWYCLSLLKYRQETMLAATFTILGPLLGGYAKALQNK